MDTVDPVHYEERTSRNWTFWFLPYVREWSNGSLLMRAIT